jgi:unsaturated rhamnogalacturonyl hydrolase
MRPTLRLAALSLVLLGLVARAATPAETLALMERVATWQIAHPPKDTAKEPVDGWVQAAGYTGIIALSEISENPLFHDAMMKMGNVNHWKPASRMYHADDQCVSQTYIALYTRDHEAGMIGATIERFDAIMAHPKEGSLEFTGKDKTDRWSWCDSLFMAPPAWARLSAVTGNPAYVDYMIDHWWKTSAYLYDKDEHLYFRDSTYFDKHEANGKKVFWARGNGWVVGGLARVLQYLPVNHPARGKFEQQLKEMAARVITLQQADGTWRSSLLDPASYPAEEASGSGFFCYGLLWGVNHGVLDRATYLPPAMKAWDALVKCVQADGKLIHVQPIGADPKKFDPESTEPYGVGAFLLAGAEVYHLKP